MNRFPFDWKHPFGYTLAILIEFLLTLSVMRYLACFSTLAFGSFWFALQFAKELIAGLNSINECVQAKESETKILKRLNETIAMHADVKQLSAQQTNTVHGNLSFERFISDASKLFRMCLKQQMQSKFSAA